MVLLFQVQIHISIQVMLLQAVTFFTTVRMQLQMTVQLCTAKLDTSFSNKLFSVTVLQIIPENLRFPG